MVQLRGNFLEGCWRESGAEEALWLSFLSNSEQRMCVPDRRAGACSIQRKHKGLFYQRGLGHAGGGSMN